jgi:hypothetical protein
VQQVRHYSEADALSNHQNLITKALISGVIVVAASEAAKRSPTYGALLVSLPLISILAMIWLWRDTGDNERIVALSEGTFWLVLPTLPMFLAS